MEWSPLKVCSLSNKMIVLYTNFMGLYVHYNPQNELYVKKILFPLKFTMA